MAMNEESDELAVVESSDEAPPQSEFMRQMYVAAGDAAQLLRCIGSEHRLMILCVLMEGSKTVTEICQAIGARQSLVSQHLTRLRLDGLVKVERQGHFAYYSMHDPIVREIVGAVHRYFCPASVPPPA
jgi:ArsR family transcriptional regulator, virulence genes transcriptional regulator